MYKGNYYKDGKSKAIANQRDILGILVSQSYVNKTGVDMEKVLTYPLVSISLCTPGGSNRKTAKSKLYDAAMEDEVTIIDSNNLTGIPNLENYFLDVVVFMRIMTNTSGSIRDLAWKVVNSIPVQYQKIYLLCDTYKEGSIKTDERRPRGSGKWYVIKSPNMKIPSDFSNFLKNGDNKTMLLDLIDQALIEDKSKLKDRIIFHSNRDYCRMISVVDNHIIDDLASDHEEADTKLVALVKASDLPSSHSVMVRSPSGDIAILALFLLHDGIRVLIDNDTGNARKIIDIHSARLSIEQRRALAGMHAFSGNDYVSSFFRKGKTQVWKEILKNPQFIQVFGNLGNFNFENLEKYVCSLYGYLKQSYVNKVRTLLFIRRFYHEHKPIDLCSIPLSSQSLHLHSKRSNYVSASYQRTDQLIMDMENTVHHGWNEHGDSIWSLKSYPDDVAELLLNYD